MMWKGKADMGSIWIIEEESMKMDAEKLQA